MAKRPKRLKYGTGKGRRRKIADRHPSGEVVRPKANPLLVERRKAMCADPTQSTNPLDCAFANGWISEKDHRAGRQYATIYSQCGFRIGATSASAGQEVDIESELTKLSLSQLSDEVICAAWDRVMARPLKLGLDSDGSLLKRWNEVNRPLSAVQHQQVYLVCVMDSWPQWVVQRQKARVLTEKYETKAKAERRALTDEEQAHIYKHKHSHWERDRDNLIKGLANIRKALRPPSIQSLPDPIESVPAPRARKRAESTVYVDQEGQFIREVVRLVAIDTAS